MLRRLEGLVSIDSGSYDRDGVNAMGDAVEALWTPLGFAAARRAIGACGDLRLLTRRLGGRGRLLILGHLDTVWPRGTVADWGYREDADFAHGPGVGDMKGGLVLAHAAVEALLESGFDGLGEIRHLLVPDEELGSPASRPHIEEEALAADWVLVMEPAREDGSVILARGALGALVMRAEGVSAHVLAYADGVSAVRALASKVAALEALSRPESGCTVSVGVIKGGDARQVVPRSCEIHIDLRAPDQDAAGALLARIRAVMETGHDPRVAIGLEGGITRPAFPAAMSRGLYGCARAIAAGMGFDYPGIATRGGSDGSFAAALGRPTLDGLGPVCFDTCSRRERILKNSLAERGGLLAELIRRLPTLPPLRPEGAKSWV